MRALLCREFAGIEELVLAENHPEPKPGPGEVTIRVQASGMNFLDTLIVAGRYQVKPEVPFSPGAEVAGEVIAVGPDVSVFSPGDRVVAFTYHGGFAEVCRAQAAFTWPLPPTIDPVTAAASLITHGTAWFGLIDRARLHAGETCLVLGAAGGVGLAAIQVARMQGAHVIACASSQERLSLCRDHGADQCIDYTQPDFRDRLKATLAGRPLDVVVDMVGGSASQTALRQLAWRGRLLVIGFASGEIPQFPANLILLRGVDVQGIVLDGLFRHEADNANAQLSELFAALASGRLRPPLVRTVGLAQACEALRALSDRQSPGKVVVLP